MYKRQEPYQKRTAHGMILGLNPHSFVNLPADEQEKLLKEDVYKRQALYCLLLVTM